MWDSHALKCCSVTLAPFLANLKCSFAEAGQASK